MRCPKCWSESDGRARDHGESRMPACDTGEEQEYWHCYYDAATLSRSQWLRQTHVVESTGVSLHVDTYPRPEPGAPVILFNHGAAGYCRLFVSLALSLYDRGYTVVLPDQRGQGLSGGPRGDYTLAECVENIVDTASWAVEQYEGPLFMAGGSVGGALTYYAAAAGAPALAIACLNLFDLGAAPFRRREAHAARRHFSG